MMKYIEEVKVLRKKMIMLQIKFADYLEVSFGTVNRWDKGNFTPTVRAKRKLVPAFKKHNIKGED